MNNNTWVFHKLEKNDNIGMKGFATLKQKKNQQQNVTPSEH